MSRADAAGARDTPGEPIPPERIETPRLVLRAWRREDAAALKRALEASVDHLRVWTPWVADDASATEEETAGRLGRFRESFFAGGDRLYGIFPPDEREVFGGVGLYARVGPNALELGYWLRADATGRGYATEAARALTRAAFAHFAAERVEIHCDPDNAASAAVARRLGYRHVATLRETERVDGRSAQSRDNMIWEVTPTTWRRENA
jgi:RimJ/RimL family protein N-acetyltransferase